MNLIFAGTPEFAAVALAALLDAGHAVRLVLTQPDRPAGRGMRARESNVKQLARERGLAVAQPATLKTAEAEALLRAQGAEAMVVAAYGLILPQAILDIPPRGCLNIHASLLPRWRGAAPIQRALLAGDGETGITIMHMNAGLDTGDILLQASTPITVADTAQTLHDRLAALGGECIVRALRENPPRRPQDGDCATYAAKLDKAEAMIDWRLDATTICRRIRAYNPVPGASTDCGGVGFKIWAAEPLAAAAGAAPGTVLRAAAGVIEVAAGSGAVSVRELQRAGGRRLSAAEFLRGAPLAAGARFGPPPVA